MTDPSAPAVALLLGSASDLPRVEAGIDVLRDLAVPFEVKILSAHRSPEATARYAREAADRGIRVIVCAAGGAAHLAGVVASHTLLPVIGIPLDATPLRGLDALLATVQMPAGIPVATVAVGAPGAANAAVLAARILALDDGGLAARLRRHREHLTRRVEEAEARVRAFLEAGARAAPDSPGGSPT